MNAHLTAIAQASAVLIAGSFASVLAKLALRDVPAFTFVWLQITIGGGLLTLYTFAFRRERIPPGLGREVWAYILWIGIGNTMIVRVLFMLALSKLPATTLTYLVNFVGLVTMWMSIVILREKPGAVQLLGAIVAILGLKVFFREIPPPAERIGVVYVAVGVLALASANNITRRLALVTENGLSNSVVSTVALWIGGLPVVLVGLFTDWPPAVSSGRHWGIIALNGVVSITIGLTVWNYVLRTLRSYEASILGTSTVFYTAFFAAPILGERLALHQIAGIVAMLAGVALVQRRPGLRAGAWGRRDRPRD